MTATTTVATGRPDTPRSAYSVLQRRATIATALVLLALAALGWWETTRQSADMHGMVQGIAQVGTDEVGISEESTDEVSRTCLAGFG